MGNRFFLFFLTMNMIFVSCDLATTVEKTHKNDRISVGAAEKENRAMELQLTDEPRNHLLGPFNSFSPDGKWLTFTPRSEKGIGATATVEKVNVTSGEIMVLYKTPHQTEYGPGVGAANYASKKNKVVFLHGLMNCTKEKPYEQWRRTAVAVDESAPGKSIFLDARDVTPPFTPGALRGGTHAHEWSGDGEWITFTYNDAIMADIEARTGNPVNLRTIGVSTSLKSVTVDHDTEGENNDGIWFSVLLVNVVPDPEPGSDEISRAFENGWVGTDGYQKSDGSRQRAVAFLGQLRTREGSDLVEVFIVDVPERIDIPGKDNPLEGTDTLFPMPPAGTRVKRLTYTEDRKYPGVCTEPRMWVRSSPDGAHIAFLAKDDNGVTQIYFVSPLGGTPLQVTRHATPIQSSLDWSPDGERICYVCDNSIYICDVREGGSFGHTKRMTPLTDEPPFRNICWSPDGKMIAYNRSITYGERAYLQIFILKLE